MIRNTIFIILILIFFQKKAFSSDPFTHEIGLIKEPEVIGLIDDNSDEATNVVEKV